MKLAAITVTYNPDISIILQNIESYINNLDLMILWDNSEPGVDLSPITQHYPNIVIHHDGINHGLSVAYNWAIDYANKHNCTHLMTMDQDSRFERFEAYREWVERSNHPGISSTAINKRTPLTEECTTINDSAQSGSIFPLSMIEKIGPFREDLFISMVDAEMCLRAQERGFKTIQYNGSNLIHHIGSERKVSLLGHSTYVSDYNPLRHYYDSRNRILMWHEFPYDMGIHAKTKHFIGRIKVLVKIIFFEKNKNPKIQAILSGTWYGLFNNPKPYTK